MSETTNTTDPLVVGDRTFQSRLLTGTGKFLSSENMSEALDASGTEIVTVALRRANLNKNETSQKDLLDYLSPEKYLILPNTSGANTAEEAVRMARLATSAGLPKWVKLEIHPDQKYLLPDPIETLRAAEILVKEGYQVLPYINADPVLAKRLEEAGTVAVMPLGAPIGSNQGLQTIDQIKIIIEQSLVPVIVDAGIGSPSHASQALEIGADAVLVNTAIASAQDSIAMAQAFKMAVDAGRIAYQSGLASPSKKAQASSPNSSLTGFLNN